MSQRAFDEHYNKVKSKLIRQNTKMTSALPSLTSHKTGHISTSVINSSISILNYNCVYKDKILNNDKHKRTNVNVKSTVVEAINTRLHVI